MGESKSFSLAGYLKENYKYFHLKDTAGQERDFHFHDFDKLVILLSGKVDYLVENERYELKAWDILLVKHHTIHRAIIDKRLPYERIIIYLDRKFFDRAFPDARLMDCFETADRSGRHLLEPNEDQVAALRQVIDAYENALGDTGFGSQTMRDTFIMQLLIQVGRVRAVAPEEERNAYDPKIEKILSYINENLTSPLSVESLADQVYLSKYHFMRLFKAQTGSTVHSYVRQKRLMYAARLIREGIPASQAAADSGFSDYSSFHRAFKESFGISPGQLKK